MHIKKFVKKKDGWYELVLEDDRQLLIHEELIFKYDLLLTRQLTSIQENELLEENNVFLAYNKALKYIERKMRSIKEMRNYLSKLGLEDNIIEQVVLKLASLGYLNDKEYARAYVNDRISLSNDGPYKIIDNLKQNKISDEIIQEVIVVFDNEKQIDRIKKLISKYIKSNTNKGANLLKQKILLNLVNLGYERQLIIKTLDGFKFNDKEILEKEYKKIYDKLSKKYSGKELEYKIKQKLYQKGFYM